jgi:TPR repeat protein
MQSHQCFPTYILVTVCAASLGIGATCVAMPRQESSGNITVLTMQCDQGNYASCFALGTKYMTGIEVPKDVVRAAKLYQSACDHGNAKGCSALGLFYKTGIGVKQDIERAAVLCRRGCERGDGLGCAMLASMYETGEGLRKDMAAAVSFYQRGCDNGNPLSCAELGRMYFSSTGVSEDDERAIKLYQHACDERAALGCAGLGFAYGVGKGVAKDEAVAATFFQRACDLNYSKACATLAAIYEQGRGVTKDIPRALELYDRACALPEKQGCDSVSRLQSSVVQQQKTGPSSTGVATSGIQMLSDTEGVDFNSYLREVYVSVKKRWFANMPASIEKGQKGVNIVEFRILRDGSVPKNAVKMLVSSQKSDFDAASLQGISEAAPFSHLPELYSEPFIVLRITFYYNLPLTSPQ